MGWRSNIIADIREEDSYEYNADEIDFPSHGFNRTGLTDFYVTDENGNDYHFLGYLAIVDGTETVEFVPYPTGKHEKNPYQATLNLQDDGSLILAKKFGTTVTYEPVTPLDSVYNNTADGNLIPNDRILGGNGYKGYSYYRATTVIGRGGVGNLTYAYAANDTLVPETIKGTGGNDTSSAGNLTISIEQDAHGHVTDVWDSDNNHTHYGYTYTSEPVTGGNLTELANVTDAMNGTVSYSYNITPEYDNTTLHPSGAPGPSYYHFNVVGISDQNSHAYAFNYHANYEAGYSGNTTGFQSYQDNGGNVSIPNYYPAHGRPLMVGNVTLPTIGNVTPVTHFYNDSFVELAPGDGTSGNTGITLSGNGSDSTHRHTIVVDADGRRTEYAWSNGTAMLQDEPEAAAYLSPNSLGELVAWGNLTMKYYGNATTSTALGQEEFTFDKSAGMALMRTVDFSNQTTTFAHGDEWTVPTEYKNALPGVFDDSVNGYFGNYDDPTSQTNAASLAKTFKYDHDTRLMRDIIDESGNLTHYQFDGGDANLTITSPGLRTAEIHYIGNTTSGTKVAETDYTYGNTTFPGVLTDKVVQELDSSHPAGTGNLEVSYDLDSYGRVAHQYVAPGSLNLTTTYTYSTAGDKLTETDPLGHTTYFTYDGRHRLTNVLYPDSSSRSYTYDARGNPLTETDENGHQTQKIYDALNRLTSVTRVMSSGNVVSGGTSSNLTTQYTYNNTGARTGVTDANGNTTTFVYDGLNRLTETDSPAVSMGYSVTTNGTGGVDVSSYNGTAYSTTHYSGNYSQTDYYDDYNQNYQTQWSVSGNTYSLYTTAPDPEVYANDSQNITGAPLVTHYFYDADNNPGGNAFDSSSFKPTRTVDPRGFETIVAYDGLYRPVAQSSQFTLGGTSNTALSNNSYFNGTALYAVTTKSYDDVGNLLTMNVSVNGSATAGNISGTPETTSYTYDALNRLTATTLADNTTVSTAYTSTGLAYNTTDELSHVTSKTYDGAGRVTAVTQPGNITTSTTYDKNGNVETVKNPLGQTWEYFYDARNRKVAEIQPAVEDWSGGGGGAFVTPTIRTTYDAAGNVQSVTDARGNTTTTLYDDANRATYTFTPVVGVVTGNTSANASLVTAKAYDANGNVLAVKQGTASDATAGSANLTRTTAANTYDALNRLTATTDGAGDTVTNAYDRGGNRIAVLDGLGTAFRYYYDGLNRLMAQNSSTFSNPEYDTFNAINKTAQSHDYFGAYDTVSYTYDARNRLKHRGVAAMTQSGWSIEDNDDAPTEAIAYDYAYDAGGNLLAVKPTMIISGVSTYTNVAYAYDSLNRQVLEIQGPAISNISSVSANGTQVPNGVSGGFVNSYTYDAAGNRLTATYGVGRSDARELTSAYDNLNRVKSISEQLVSASSPERQTYYHYDAAGNRVALVQPNYGYVETSFDALGRQAEVEGYKPSAESGELYDFALGYDAFGNLQEQVETYPAGQLGNRTVTLGYDGADRLTTETMLTGTTNITSAYEYDSANDRTSKVTTQQIGNATATTLVNDVYSYLPGNRLQYVYHYTGGNVTSADHYNINASGLGHGAVTFWDHYTVSGNTATLQSTWKYNYDLDNRLVEVAKMDSGHLSGQGGFYAYAYDYRGRRVARESLTDWVSAVFSGGTDVREYRASQTAYSYSWQWWAQVIWQMPTWNVGNVTSAPSVEYVRGSDWGGGVGGVLYSLHSDNAQYYHYDGRGDVVAQTTGSLGSLVYQSAYNAYGEHNPSGTSFVPAAAGTQEYTASGATTDDLRANTKEEDPTGLSLQDQRPLLIGTNTWMTPDPMGMIDGTNMYGYCKMNPYSGFDPQGLWTGDQKDAEIASDKRAVADDEANIAAKQNVIAQEKADLAGGNLSPNYASEVQGNIDKNEKDLYDLNRSRGIKDRHLADDEAEKKVYLEIAKRNGLDQHTSDTNSQKFQLGASAYFDHVGTLQRINNDANIAADVVVFIESLGEIDLRSGASVEQYSLRARQDGFYPVMKRGFAEPQGGIWLEQGDVWKFGTTKNPTARYTNKFLEEWDLRYQTESSGTLSESLQAEKQQILNYQQQNGVLPPGNKIVK